MSKVWVIGVAITVGLAGAASAQAPQAAEPEEQVKARQKIFMMEGVLERAVQLGVDNLRRKVRSVMPDDALVQGSAPTVRGFRLDGYGIFFDIEVPALRQSMAWTLRTMNETGAVLARDLAQMRAFATSIADPQLRAEVDRTIQRIQQQLGPVPPTPARAAAQGSPGPLVTAQSVEMPQAAPAPPPVDPLLLDDPSEAYTREVKAAVIDAMIENSGPLVLEAQERLTVAARDDARSDPFMAGDPDVRTILLTIRGSDLNAFRNGQLTLDEVRAKVDVREF